MGKSLRRILTACALIASTGYFIAPPSAPAALAAGVSVVGGAPAAAAATDASPAASLTTATPIKHLIVIFQENISFDHYFATYPNAANPPGEPPFHAAADTPTVNNLLSAGLLAPNNPNSVQPFRLDRSQAYTCDQDHGYTNEQKAFDGGKMDKVVEYTNFKGTPGARQYCPPGIVMGYFDGNTVTALWNYAQHYAMNDNSFGTTFGPSTPGALEVTAANPAGVVCGPTSDVYQPPATCSASTPPPTSAGTSSGTMYADADPYYDDCSSGGTTSKSSTGAMVNPTVGDLLNKSGITWGWFEGGFDNCKAQHNLSAFDRAVGVDPASDKATLTTDYSPHHQPFQYFSSTANPHHLTPTSTAMIGKTDQANHQYDLTDFWAAADAGNLPAVSYLKAPKNQDGHPGNSDPLDEQEFIVDTVNHLESLPSWRSTAIIIGYDDSDGWYDHVAGSIVNHSSTSLDADPRCTTGTDGSPARCGYGPRLPYLVVSPYARTNFVDHTLTDQTSTVRFIEDNWLGGQRLSGESFDNKAGSIVGMFDFSHQPTRDLHRLFLDPFTGEPSGIGLGQGFQVSFTSSTAGRGMVLFGSGPGCLGLVQTATQDLGAGTTQHTVVVTGNDLPGTVGNIGITPGATYYYEVETVSALGTEIDNNGGKCYTVTVPSS